MKVDPPTVTVTSARTDTGELGLTLYLTVQRHPSHIAFSDVLPRPADVPLDLRDAVQRWLSEETP